jgi:hypothetical protein
MTWQLAAYCRTADLYANRSECRYSAKLMLIVTYGPNCRSRTLSMLRRSFPEVVIGTGAQHFDTTEVRYADKAAF